MIRRTVSRGLPVVLAVVPAFGLMGCDEGKPAEGQPARIFGERGLGPGQFVYPRAFTIAPDGAIFVVDKYARIQRFTAEGTHELTWQMPEWANGKPTGLYAGPDGLLYVADTHYHQVMVFDRDGKEVRRFGSVGEALGQFLYPTAVAIDAAGNIFVAEYGGNDRITRFTAAGEPVLAFGDASAGEAALLRPQGMRFDRQGVLWVADACHHRICRFDTDGHLLSTFGTQGTEPGQLQYPYDLDFLPDGSVVVVEFGNCRVQRFDATGKLLAVRGGPGREPGQFAAPWGVSVGRRGGIYVLDSGNDRVQLFE